MRLVGADVSGRLCFLETEIPHTIQLLTPVGPRANARCVNIVLGDVDALLELPTRSVNHEKSSV